MKNHPVYASRLKDEIEAADGKLHELEKEIAEIPEPASESLRQRLHALQIEESALRRNYSEMVRRDKSDPAKAAQLEKMETLLHHIEDEESSLEHDAHFLHQGSPTTVSAAVHYSSLLIERGTRALKKTLGDDVWHSPFVNHTYDSLATRFDVPESKD